MKQTEKILGGLVIILIAARLLFYVPFLNTLILMVTIVLAGTYFFLSFGLLNTIRLRNIFKKKAYTGIGAMRIVGAICTGVFLSLTCIYILFKFMQWPYGDQGLIISLPILLIPLVIATVKYVMIKNAYYKNFVIRLLLIGGIGTLFLFTSSEKLLEMKFRDYPEYIEAEKKLMKDPSNNDLYEKAREERKKIDSSN